MITTTLIKLGIAALLGMSLGLERELKRKPLGLKTTTIICIASCLITIVSIEAAYNFPAKSHITMDPLRLAAQIVSGVGFIGAGVILVKGLTVTGLTTSAMIWGASALGISVGAGFWKEALITAVLIIVCVDFLPNLIKRCGPKRLRTKEFHLVIIVSELADIEDIHKQVKSKDIKIHKIKVKDLSSNERKIELTISTNEKRYTTNIYQSVKSISGVSSVEISNS